LSLCLLVCGQPGWIGPHSIQGRNETNGPSWNTQIGLDSASPSQAACAQDCINNPSCRSAMWRPSWACALFGATCGQATANQNNCPFWDAPAAYYFSPFEQSYTLISSSGYDSSTQAYPSLVFDGDANSGWDATQFSQGPNYLVWSTAWPIVATQFSYISLGDTTHDPRQFEVFYSDDSVTWVSAGQFSGSAGLNTKQSFSISTDGKAHQYWQWKIYNTFTQWQSWIAEAWLSFSTVLQQVPQQSYTVLTSNGYNNLFDGNTATSWEPLPEYITWSTPSPVVGSQFSYVSIGDTAHDPQNFQILYSDNNSSWVSAGSFTGKSGLTRVQNYHLATDGKPHQYWQLSISSTFSGSPSSLYEAWLWAGPSGTSLVETNAKKRVAQNVLIPGK